MGAFGRPLTSNLTLPIRLIAYLAGTPQRRLQQSKA